MQTGSTVKDVLTTVDVLNDLVEINNDRIAGYEKAMKELKDEDDDLRTVFNQMISESLRAKQELVEEVVALGGEVRTGTTNSEKIYRAWMDVRATFSGHDRYSVLANCEAGEDALQKAYRTALESDEIPSQLEQAVRTQQQTLRRSHDKIKALRDASK
ncbi:MAG: PA2169 family four-helix-bundle protein [Chitinophagaceae bacterium]